MKYLLLWFVMFWLMLWLSACTIKVVLPEEPIPVHQATLQAGEDLIRDVVRVQVIEPPPPTTPTVEEICKAHIDAIEHLREASKNTYAQIQSMYDFELILLNKIDELTHDLAIARHER